MKVVQQPDRRPAGSVAENLPQQNGKAATQYAAKGWAVIPLHSIQDGDCTCGKADCSPGKHPRTAHGLNDAARDHSTIADWWREWPDANVGIVTGADSGIVVIDIDTRHGGKESLKELEAEFGQLPVTVESVTGGGGCHIFFQHPGGTIKNRTNIRPGIDVRGDGGYIVAPPSNHDSGDVYRWDEGRAPDESEIASMPGWLLQLVKSDPVANHTCNGAPTSNGLLLQRAQQYAARVDDVGEGSRNDAAFSIAGHIAAIVDDHGNRLPEPLIIDVLQPWNQRNIPPLSDQELQQCVSSALKNGTPRADKLVSSSGRSNRLIIGDSNAPALVIDFSRTGTAANTTITARIGDDVLAVDKIDLSKAKARTEFAASICKDHPGIEPDEVERLLTKQAADFAVCESKQKEETTEPKSQELLDTMPQSVRDDARAMLDSPDLMKQVIDDVASLGVAGERGLVATIYLVGVSRLLPRPLAAIVQAPSSVGKSYTVEKVSKLFPDETVIHATSLTPQSLFYMEPGALSHRFIVAGERSRQDDDEAAEATRALREMISSGKLSKLIPMKEGGQFVTQRIEQPGPIAFIETTTASNIFNEDANRCLLLSADERTQQTVAVVKRLAATYCDPTAVDIDEVVQRHHAAQRMLGQWPVVVPFAEQIAESFPTDRVEARRAFPHLMGMIQASALLHQYQRTVDGDGRLIADVDDYQLAGHLARGPLARLLGGRISDAALRFYDRLVEWGADKFTTTEAGLQDRKSPQAVRGWLRELCEAGGVEQIEPAKGNRPAHWQLTDIDRETLSAGDCGLPSAEDLAT